MNKKNSKKFQWVEDNFFMLGSKYTPLYEKTKKSPIETTNLTAEFFNVRTLE